MDARGVLLNIAWKGLIFIAKIEEIIVIGLMLLNSEMDARGVVLNIAWKGLVFIAKIEEITVIGLMLT